MLPYLIILRPINFVITFFSIIVAGLLCGITESNFMLIIFAALSGSLVGSSGNIINDYLDIEIDAVNRPGRVLPSGKMSKQSSLIYYFILLFAAIALAFLINIYALAIVLFAITVIFFYSYSLKRIPLVGNIVVAFFTGFAFIFGGVAAENWENGIIPGVFAFFVNLIREIVKDIEDTKGDLAHGVVTFPSKYGITNSLTLIRTLTIILMLITTIPFAFKIYRIEYFIIVMPLVNGLFVYFMREMSRELTAKKLRGMSNLLKLNMVFGLIAIFLGNQY
ncbi:MAG: geranylgeranylglycerol-phosphate geranylgeranyltransferase [Bacteroidetes bacterium]|nr:geranylgeranylglycerol-phosphate geranylgeranyltransferase [Bacteroidota bacterium]